MRHRWSDEGRRGDFDSAAFFRASGPSLFSLILGDEIAATEPAADGLVVLPPLVEGGVLKLPIGVEAPWTDIAVVAKQLQDRALTGKAVLHLRNS